MRRLVKSSLVKTTAYLVTLLLVLQIGTAPLVSAAAPPRGSGPDVLVFDLTNTSAGGGTQLADSITLELKTKLFAAGANLMYYDARSPVLQRAIAEGALTKEDLALPMDKDRALLIAEKMGADFAVVGTIDNYQWDEKQGQLTIGLDVSVLDVASKSTRALVQPVKSPARVKEVNALSAVANEAAYLIAKSVLGERALTSSTTRPYGPGTANGQAAARKKKRSTGLLVGLLVLAAIAAAAGGGGGGGGGGGDVTPTSDITNPVAEPLTEGVALTWECTRAGVTGYNIYRAPAGVAAITNSGARRETFAGSGGSRGRRMPSQEPVPAPVRAPSRVATDAGWTKLAQVGPGTMSYTDNVISPNGPRYGTLYQYQIRAVVGSTETTGAICRNRYTNALTVSPAELTPPTNLQFSAGPSQLSTYVSWSACVQPYVENYEVYRATSQAGPFQVLGQVPGTTLRFLDSQGLVAGTTYWYRVTASAASGRSRATSAPASYQMRAGVLQPPSNLHAYPSATQIDLAWQPSPDPAATGYYLYRNNARLGGDILEPAYSDTTAVHGQTYTYYVTAHNASGQESAPTNSITTGLRPPPQNISLSAQPQSINGDGVSVSDLTALVTDENGSPVPNVEVEFATNLGTLVPKAGTVNHTSGGKLYVVTNDAGLALGGLRAATVSQDATAVVTATFVGCRAPATASVQLLVPKPGGIEVQVVPASIPGNGTSFGTVQAVVRDLEGAPLAGAVVTMSTTAGTLRPKAGTDGHMSGADLLVTSGAGGLAEGELVGPIVTTTPVSATVTVSVVGPGGTHTDTAAVTFTVPTVAFVTVTVERDTIPGDGVSSTEVTAIVTDAAGGPMSGRTVNFTIDQPGLGVLNPTSGTTNAQGQVTVTLTSASDGAYGTAVITATSDGVPGLATVHFSPPQLITLAVNPATLPAGGQNIEALLTATCKYITNIPVPGAKVMFGFESPGGYVPTAPSGAAIKETGAQVTDANGICYNHVISAPNLDNGVADTVVAWIDEDENGAYTPGEPEARVRISYTAPPASVELVASPDRIPANGSATSIIAASVYTAEPNPLDPGRFLLVGDGVPVTLTTQQGVFQETGTSTCTLRTVRGSVQAVLKSIASTTEITSLVTATACTVSQSVPVVFYPAPTGPTMEITAVPSVLAANGQSSATIIASLRDAEGVAIGGQSVEFTTTLGSLNSNTATTGGDGRASVTLTAGLTAGTAAVTASALGATATVLVPIRTGVPKNIYVSRLVPTIIPATNGLSSPAGVPVSSHVLAVVTDADGYPVPNADVRFTTDIGRISPSVYTNTEGEAMAEIIACDYLTASDPSRAHAGRGLASVNVSCGEVAWVQPELFTFAGDCDLWRWDGFRTGTDIFTPEGATFDQPGGHITEQPYITPTAGGKMKVMAIFRDSNDNPLPMGMPVIFSFNPGSGNVDSPVQRTYLKNGECYAEYEFPITTVGNKDSAYPARIGVNIEGAVTYEVSFSTTQWIGAAAPSSISFLGTPNRWPGYHDVTVEVRDRFDNRVQDYNVIHFRVIEAQNLSAIVIHTPESAAPTIGGRATIQVEAVLANPAQNGSYQLEAWWNDDVKATFGITVVSQAAGAPPRD